MNELDIINLDSSDKTYEDIAREVNLNKEQVRYIFKKNKIKKLKSHSSIEDLSQNAIEDILNNYNNFSYSYFIKKYNTTEKILINFLKKHNLKKDRVLSFPPEDNWTDEELEILKNNYEFKTNNELTDLLPNRTVKSISKKLWSLSLYRTPKWSEKEDEILRKYSYLSYEALSFLLERTPKAIVHRINILNIAKSISKKTSIEEKIEKILIKNNINYVYNEYLSKDFKFKPDFILKDHNLIIECQGDYYHANPLYYDDEDLNEMQRTVRIKDSVKKEYYDSLNYNSLFLWETTINNALNDVENIILDLCKRAV